MLHGRLPVCAESCVQKYADRIGHEIAGEHATYGPEGRTMSYFTRRPDKNSEAKE